MSSAVDHFDVTDFPAQPDGTTVTGLTVWPPSKFREFTLDPSANLLGEGLLEKGEWTSFLGVGGLGKTRMVLWLAICQITGREWCGLSTTGAPQTVLFLSTETSVRRWKSDLERMFTVLSSDEQAAVETHLRILALTPEEDGTIGLDSIESSARLAATLRDARPGMVVFDPFADMVDGDENKTADVVGTLRRLRAVLRENAPTAAVLIIHHARTGAGNVAQAGDNFAAGNFGRGSKALYSRVRAELQLAPADRDDSTRLVLACGKANNGPKFAPRGIVFDPQTSTYSVDPTFDVDDWRNNVSGKREGTAVTVRHVVEIARSIYQTGEDVSTARIVEPLREQTGASAKTIQRRLKEATKLGYLREGSKRGTWRLGAKTLKS